MPQRCHYDESSECETARQHKVAGVACYRLERTLMGCADPPSKRVGGPHQCSRVNKNRSGLGGSALTQRAWVRPGLQEDVAVTIRKYGARKCQYTWRWHLLKQPMVV